ncbi:MAG TPA: GNAT family N-acetyltransferase [Steroidobacteraceae bacterium]|jgi:GNAT superfamily N-acetyltransferase|nr:GNAT family N-acetyltransferase [Steroidobacteraceae bacterium]
MTTAMHRGEYTITTDRDRFDLAAIHRFLTRSYWSPGVPIAIVERSIANSLCFGLFHERDQVGLARVITDKATFAYLSDVYVLESHRGKGLSKWLLAVIRSHEDLQGLRRFMLSTQDAHGLYSQFGFTALAFPSRMMEVLNADPYRTPTPTPAPTPAEWPPDG